MIEVEPDDVQLRIEVDDEAFHNLPCLPCHPTIALYFAPQRRFQHLRTPTALKIEPFP